MSLSRGTQLDRYEVLSPLGAGGMGEVYLALDTRLERQVALKLLPLTFATDASRMRRFVREAKTASHLNHPNILVVYEIIADGSQPFIVAEFVEGVTLGQRLADGPCAISVALDIAIQIANALAAAHAAGVVHRDIKPDNIMIRPDGVVKVLDFGLARFASDAADTCTQTSDGVRVPKSSTVVGETTALGVVLGTTGYMSPEQARGLHVDQRSDVFSAGVVLYEMLAGRAPFTRETASDTIAALLQTEPTPLDAFVPDAPRELWQVVKKSLAKTREERYTTGAELLRDLMTVKSIVVTSALARVAVSPTSRMSRFVSHVRRYAVAAAVAAALLAGAVTMRLSQSTRVAALTDKDTILIADFANTTGEAVFDGALKQGLAVQLAQSPFLSILPDTRVRDTLRLMGRPPDDAVTPAVAREIGQRQGLKAFISGSIARFDRHYSIALEATATRHGDTIALTQAEAAGKDQVLQALSRAATDLRERLGESLTTIQAFDAPLELTTSSLEALNAYSLGEHEAARGSYREAIAFFQQAVELDPGFAYGWAKLAVHHFNTRQPALATQFARRAFALRDRVSELERLRISSLYSGFIDGDVDEALKVLERYKRTYPRDPLAPTNLASAYVLTGQFDRAIAEARAALRLNPTSASAFGDLASALLAEGQVEEASETAKQAMRQRIDSVDLRSVLYLAGFIVGARAQMQEQLEWARGRPDEHVAFEWQARTAAAAGQRAQADELTRRAVALAAQTGAKELAARYTVEGALRNAAFGVCSDVNPAVTEALAFDRTHVTLTRGSLAIALCGDSAGAQPFVRELMARYPKDSVVNSLWLPLIRGATELERGNPGRTLQQLEAVRFEGAGDLWPHYLRARAFARERAWPNALAQFNAILARHGQASLSPLGAVAHVGVAEAAAGAGQSDLVRKSYERVLSLWKDADPKLPMLIHAKTEYAKLQ